MVGSKEAGVDWVMSLDGKGTTVHITLPTDLAPSGKEDKA